MQALQPEDLIPRRSAVRDVRIGQAGAGLDEPALIEIPRVCAVCTRQFSKYCCPRCSLRYCSLPCYKAHSGPCVATFSQEGTNESLRGLRADSASTSEMLEILRRVHLDDTDEEDDNSTPSTLEKISSKLNAGAPVDEILASMPEELKKSFQQSLANGELSSHIEMWTPYWCLDLTGSSSDVPKSTDDVPDFETLTKAHPPGELKFNSLNIIYAYACACRYYNGAWKDDVVGAAGFVLNISLVLSDDRRFCCVSDALNSGIEQALQPSAGLPRSAALAVCKDVADIISSLSFSAAAFSEAHQMMSFAFAAVKNLAPKVERRQLMQAKAKLHFFRSWFKKYGGELLLLHSSVLQYGRSRSSSGVDV